jgi:hypothetical protein
MSYVFLAEMEYWSNGVLEYWSNGVLEYWIEGFGFQVSGKQQIRLVPRPCLSWHLNPAMAGTPETIFVFLNTPLLQHSIFSKASKI